ncbi:MAG: toxin-antitoxin system HicB family antitoxin [Acidimicrobiales bacterium]
MDLWPYIEDIHRQLQGAAATGGEEAQALAERLAAPLDSALRLSLLDALAAAAQEITCELAPGSVELRLRGREPEFVVTAPPVPPDGVPTQDGAGGWATTVSPPMSVPSRDDEAMARVNVRMPDHLKARVDEAAAAEGLSVNAWLVRAAAAAVERADPPSRLDPAGPQGPRRITGWAR